MSAVWKVIRVVAPWIAYGAAVYVLSIVAVVVMAS